jgi:hypothetical protein
MSRRGVWVIGLWLAMGVRLSAQVKEHDVSPPQAAVTKAPQNAATQIRSTVGFLRIDYARPTKEIVGTCFFVFFPDERLAERIAASDI